MNVKDKMLQYVEEHTYKTDVYSDTFRLTAQYIADEFGIKRNTASMYLNQAHEEGILIKVETRPVVFFSRKVFEKRFFRVNNLSYMSIRELMNSKTSQEKSMVGIPEESEEHRSLTSDERAYDMRAFSQLVGFDKSLNSLVNRLMSSLLYPGPKSMPLMLHGQTGVGKSFLAKVIHQFCRDNGILKSDAPLVIFNCAQYANNPELMSSKLFGYVKGAFTGAKEDTPGLFDAAEGGILFIDEAHRLSSENQEKFFSYLDYGTFTRLGEISRERKANVRIILATTENIESSFLETFRRRIGINVYIPSFKERSYSERLQMVYQFLYMEHRNLNRNIHIRKRMTELLAIHEYPSNVGELEMVIKSMCAATFARSGDNPDITISYIDVPSGYMDVKEELDFISETQGEMLVVNDSNTPDNLMSTSPLNKYRDDFYRKLSEIDTPLTEESEEIIKKLVRTLVSDVNCSYAVTNKLPMESRFEKDILTVIETWLKKKVDIFPQTNKASSELCAYIYMRCFTLKMPHDLVTENIVQVKNYVSCKHPEEYAAARLIIKYFRYRLRIEFNELDEIILSTWISQNKALKVRTSIYSVIASHGKASGYGMSNYANKTLGSDIFDYIDIERVTDGQSCAEFSEAQYVLEKIKEVVSINNSFGSVVLMWDTELTEAHLDVFRKKVAGRVLLIESAAMSTVLKVGQLLVNGATFDELSDSVGYSLTESITRRIDNRNNSGPALLCCSHKETTDDNRIENIIRNAIPEDVKIDVVTFDFDSIKEKKNRHEIFSKHKVVAIIGLVDPVVPGYLFVPLEEVISQADSGKLRKELSRELPETDVERILNGFVDSYSREQLIENLTILDVRKVIENVESSLLSYEEQSGIRLSGRIKLLILIHMSCLIERLIRHICYDRSGLPAVIGSDDRDHMVVLKKCFSNIEKTYHVHIPEEEIYLMNEYIKTE